MITLLTFFVGYASREIEGIVNLFELPVSHTISQHYFRYMDDIGNTIKVTESEIYLAMAEEIK